MNALAFEGMLQANAFETLKLHNGVWVYVYADRSMMSALEYRE